MAKQASGCWTAQLQERAPGDALEPNSARADLSYGMGAWGGLLGPFTKMDLDDSGSPRLGGGLRFDILNAPDAPAAMPADGLRLELFGDYRLGIALVLTY